MTIKDIRSALFTLVTSDPAIAAVIGAKMYPVQLPQGVKGPALVYSRVSGLGDAHMQGPSGLTRPRFQIDAWAETSDAAASLANLVKGRIDGFSGDIAYGSNSPQDSVNVQGIFYDSERDFYDFEAKLHRVSRDYFIWYREF